MNTIIQAILSRNASSKLTSPAPSAAQIEHIIQAALRAPDHALLRPWRYIVVEGEALNTLGAYLVAAKQDSLLAMGKVLSEDDAEKLAQKPQRAPMIIIPVLCYVEHEKVPEVEQLLSLGAGCQNLLLATESLGFHAIWRTGALAFSRSMHQSLSLKDNEKCMGFIYIGSKPVEAKLKTLPTHDTDNFLSFL